jgi:hypothetical protein
VSFLVLQAYLKLIQFDLYLACGNFSALYHKVRAYPIRKAPESIASAERICAAVDMACIWYWKEVQCLQRSSATACLLKRQGAQAHMMIGVQEMPFKAHAWVEMHGQVVNDKPYMREIYLVLDQC